MRPKIRCDGWQGNILGSERGLSSKIFREKTVDSPLHLIFRHMHATLNIDKK
jgi:hypothetical protein